MHQLFFGNTLVLMGVMCTAYDLRSCSMALFSGDDSLILSKSDLSMDTTDTFSSLFNLETKLLRYKYYYFCSKFLLPVEDRWFFIPDPLKLVSKLGRKDLANFDHAREYYTSYKDLTKDYNSARINSYLNAAVSERYRSSFSDLSAVFSALKTLASSEEKFLELYYVDPRDVLCNDPSRAKLD